MDDKMSEQLTANQKDTVYKDMLIPLKSKISQILLYDTEAAATFLSQYNDITLNDEISVSELMLKISELEISVQEYEQTTGKEKLAEERARVLSDSIRDFNIKSVDMSIDAFEEEFLKFREGYDAEIVNQAYGDRDALEHQFHSLQASLIMRKISESKDVTDLSSIIKEDDKVALGIWVRNKTIDLKENSKYSEFSKKISDMILLKDDAVMIPELWKWIDAVEKGKAIENQSQSILQNNVALIPVKEKKKLGFFEKMSKRFSSKPSLPLTMQDIRKIRFSWLAEQLPKEMLLEEEKRRLKIEGKEVDEMYVPTPEYVLLKTLERIISTGIKHNYGLLHEEGKASKTFHVWQEDPEYLKEKAYMHRRTSSRIVISIGTEKEEKTVPEKIADVLNYVELLDRVCGSEFKQELLREIKFCYFERPGSTDTKRKKFKSSLEHLSFVCENDKLDILAKEDARRNIFYKSHPLREPNAQKTESTIVQKASKEAKLQNESAERNTLVDNSEGRMLGIEEQNDVGEEK